MPLVSAQLSKVQNLNPPSHEAPTRQMFHYNSAADTITTVKAAGYFNNVRDLVNAGDLIHVVGATDTTSDFLEVLTAPDAGNVTTRLLGQAGAALATGATSFAAGVHTTVDENDTVVSGLGAALVGVIVAFMDAPVEGAKFVWADIGDQAGAPAAGSFLVKTLKDTDADAALVNATTFGLRVSWFAFR